MRATTNPGIQDTSHLKTTAFQLLQNKQYRAARRAFEAVLSLNVISVPILGGYAICLNELGEDETADAILALIASL